MPAQNFDDIVNDMVTRYSTHVLHQRNDGTGYRPQISTSCSCGWESGVASDNLRPQWEAVDKHLIADALPDWPQNVCWCGRAILLSPLGKWFHAERTQGHGAAVKEIRDRMHVLRRGVRA